MPGQTFEDRPDIVARVFHMKLKQLKDDIVTAKVFGDVQALTYRVEFQKRGLPHVHMLAWMEDKELTSTGMASRVCRVHAEPMQTWTKKGMSW